MPTYQDLGFGQGAALTGDRARSAFGQVMGLVTVALGFSALGAYIMRHSVGGTGIIFFIGVFACIFGLQAAAARGHEQLAIVLLFGLALMLGMMISPIIVYYAKSNPGVVYDSAGSTALFTAALGSFGYGTRRDLSSWQKPLFIGLGILWIFLLVALFVAIPGENIIYGVLVLLVFGGFTAFDFNRLARGGQYVSPPLMAANIFLDIFNVFLAMLSLFGGGGRR
jgi:FtsH-binding integral membrane protein